MKKIGEQAQEFRLNKGWNSTRMAKEVGTSRQNIESLEENPDRIPKYLTKLADVMGVTVDDLMNGRYVVRTPPKTTEYPDGNTQPQIAERRAFYRVPSVETACKVLADHLNSVDGYDKPTVISLLTTLVNSPDMHAVVAAGLKTLKPQVRGDPAKHHPPAQKVHSSRTA